MARSENRRESNVDPSRGMAWCGPFNFPRLLLLLLLPSRVPMGLLLLLVLVVVVVVAAVLVRTFAVVHRHAQAWA